MEARLKLFFKYDVLNEVNTKDNWVQTFEQTVVLKTINASEDLSDLKMT